MDHFRIISSESESLWHKKVGQSLIKDFLWTGVQQNPPNTWRLKVHGITCGWTRLNGYEKEIMNTVKVLQDRYIWCLGIQLFYKMPLQEWTGPESSSRLRLPDFKTISTWRW
jgi:hypothetical protein